MDVSIEVVVGYSIVSNAYGIRASSCDIISNDYLITLSISISPCICTYKDGIVGTRKRRIVTYFST